MQEGILSVRELTDQLRKTLEGRFPFVWVRGEVTNLTRPGSGHVVYLLFFASPAAGQYAPKIRCLTLRRP